MCMCVQVIGTAISGNAVSTDTDVGDTVTYTLIPALYSNYFTLTAPPSPHLLTNVVFDYATMPTTYKMRKFTESSRTQRCRHQHSCRSLLYE